eukprot:243944-Prorocentrum_minimum.AAC.1
MERNHDRSVSSSPSATPHQSEARRAAASVSGWGTWGGRSAVAAAARRSCRRALAGAMWPVYAWWTS